MRYPALLHAYIYIQTSDHGEIWNCYLAFRQILMSIDELREMLLLFQQFFIGCIRANYRIYMKPPVLVEASYV